MKPYYQDSAVTIYHGDCREIVPTLGRFDCVITSPPYGVDANNCMYGGKKYIGKDTINFDLLEMCCPENAKHSWVNVQTLSANKAMVFAWLGTHAEHIKDVCVWVKPSPQPAMEPGVLNSVFEWLVCISRDDATRRKFDGCEWRGTVDNVFNWPRASSSNPCAKIHHATFPPQLPETLLQSFGYQTVLDPFAGSGTTGRAAKDLGRKAVLIEIEERYCEIAARRMGQEVFNLGDMA